MIRPDYKDFLRHSAKGSTWKNHKYINIIKGRYIYDGIGVGRKKLVNKTKDEYDKALAEEIKNENELKKLEKFKNIANKDAAEAYSNLRILEYQKKQYENEQRRTPAYDMRSDGKTKIIKKKVSLNNTKYNYIVPGTKNKISSKPIENKRTYNAADYSVAKKKVEQTKKRAAAVNSMYDKKLEKVKISNTLRKAAYDRYNAMVFKYDKTLIGKLENFIKKK